MSELRFIVSSICIVVRPRSEMTLEMDPALRFLEALHHFNFLTRQNYGGLDPLSGTRCHIWGSFTIFSLGDLALHLGA